MKRWGDAIVMDTTHVMKIDMYIPFTDNFPFNGNTIAKNLSTDTHVNVSTLSVTERTEIKT
jgi:hypothetical protein